jgi:hypothetical protein
VTIGWVSSTSGQLGSQLPLMSRGSKPISPPIPKDWTSIAKSTPVWVQVCPPLEEKLGYQVEMEKGSCRLEWSGMKQTY